MESTIEKPNCYANNVVCGNVCRGELSSNFSVGLDGRIVKKGLDRLR